MKHFLKFRIMFGAVAFFLGGILLIYRGVSKLTGLKSVTSKIRNLNVDVHRNENGSNIYAIVFDIDTLNTRCGMSLGSNFKTKDEDLYLSLDSTSLYTFNVDPTVASTSEGVYLGVESILLKNKKIFQSSKLTQIIPGVLMFLLSLAMFYFNFFKKQDISIPYR